MLESKEGAGYREPTPEELASTSPKTPLQHDRRVRVKCPSGVVTSTVIEFEDGESLLNVLRMVASFQVDGEGLVKVFITRFHHEIGRVVYEEALALVG